MSGTIWVYTSEKLAEQWKSEAKARDMSISSFAESMIEAGRKQVSFDFSLDDEPAELRNQRNELKSENKRLRSLVDRLQERALKEERKAILEFIEENPGVTYQEIVQHLIESTPSRTHEYLEYLTGDQIVSQEGQFYPASTREEEY